MLKICTIDYTANLKHRIKIVRGMALMAEGKIVGNYTDVYLEALSFNVDFST